MAGGAKEPQASYIDAHDAIERLRLGGRSSLVVVPTETVYGLAADATDPEAVAAIFAAKQRPAFDPLIMHVDSLAMAQQYVHCEGELFSLVERLTSAFWPGPLTLLLPRLPHVPDLVCNGLPLVGLRCPDHEMTRRIIAGVGRPLAAPSANQFGATSPTTAAAVHQQLAQPEIPIVDGGACRVGVESTVLRLTPEPLILRPGGVTAEQLKQVLEHDVAVATDPIRAAAIDAPGRLPAHYAPTVPVHLYEDLAQAPYDMSRLYWRPPAQAPVLEHGAQWLALSENGDAVVAAAHLFAYLLALAEAGRPIAVGPIPNVGLGVAMNDRLRRAAASA